jgi:5-methylcytosine-specific restriction enzyme B
MNFKERQQAFKAAIREYDYTDTSKYSESFGVSNSAKVVEGGLFVCNVNLSNVPLRHEQLILGCLIRFPPEDEVYFAVYIRSDISALRARLSAMLDRGKGLTEKYGKKATDSDDVADEEETSGKDPTPDADRTAIAMYSASNNNVKCYIAQDGKAYFRNKGFWDSLKFDLADVEPGAQVEKIAFSIWPPAASARRSLLAREFVGYLGDLIGRAKVHELRVWTDSASVSPTMRRLPGTLSVTAIETAVGEAGGHYAGKEVRRFHAALNFLKQKHFVILSGLSGTGKTRLALYYARAVHGLTDPKTSDPFLFVCAVRPEWTDPTGLTGYYDVLSNRYIVPPFLEAVLVATAYPDSPVFIVLDEMNLARVEYYFADVLSAIETGEALQLHASSVPLEGSNGTSIRAELPLPSNLYITGTINVDETTNPVSDKVLDRAIVIDMSTVDLRGFLAALEAREPELKNARAACEPYLIGAHDQMTAHGLGFGYRVAEEVVRYHAFAAEHLQAPAAETNDDLMVQKVLVKLRGTLKQQHLLTGLQKALVGLPRSQVFIEGLISDLTEFGSFQASR